MRDQDALRFEIRGFGIDGVIVEPGLIRTRFGEAAVASMQATTLADGSPYAAFNAAVANVIAGAYAGRRGA
ncbi:MAG: hypothetical protein ACRD2A_06635 [Vicinamibacterales bacterium]